MASLNKVMIMGNLGGDPEIRMTPQGKKVANFSVGVAEKYTDRNGQVQQKTEWFKVILWDGNNGSGLASVSEKYLKKGSSVYVEGKLQTSSWDDPSGIKKYKTELIGNSLQMLGSKPAQNDNKPAEPTDNFGGYGADDDMPF